MAKGDNMRRRTGTYDRETGLLIDDGYAKCSEVKSALGIVNHQIWRRTLIAAGIEPITRDATGHHFIRLEDARRLLAGARVAKPP